MKPNLVLLTTSLSLLLLTACTNQLEELTTVDNVRFAAEYAVPLVDSEVSLNELLGDVDGEVSVSADPDGLLRFLYSGEVPAVSSDVIFRQLEELARGIVLPITNNRLAAPFAVNGDQNVAELRISSGSLGYKLTNAYDRPVNVSLSIPQATLNGTPFRVSGTLPAYSGSGPLPGLDNAEAAIDLANYVLTIPEDSLYFEYEIRDTDGNLLPPSEQTLVIIQNLRFSFVRGYLGQALYPGGRDTISVDFFDRYLEGEIFFVDPTITMTLVNTFGVPAQAQVAVLSVIDVAGNVIPITGEAVESGFSFDYPRTPGDTAFTEFVFDNTNSNIAEVLSARPVALDYEINALIHPEGDTSIQGFLTDSGAYRAQVDVELPLYGNARDFSVSDTFPVDLMDRYDNITAVDFRLTTTNGLPLGMNLTGTFVDSLGNALADLADGEIQLLRAAAVDADGNPTGVVPEVSETNFTGERLEALRNAKQLIITLDISTTDGGVPFVRVTDRQQLRMQLGAVVRVEE